MLLLLTLLSELFTCLHTQSVSLSAESDTFNTHTHTPKTRTLAASIAAGFGRDPIRPLIGGTALKTRWFFQRDGGRIFVL